jgi:exosortase E/protease (VPEID-CTERM system)
MVRAQPLRISLLLLHCALALPLVPLSYLLYGTHFHLPFTLIVLLWAAFALAATVALSLAFAPWQLWRDASSALGVVWVYALCAAGLAAGTMEWSQKLWAPTAKVTFNLVRWMLAPLLPSLRADAGNLTLYTPHFAIQVADICSGLEGVGLMLAFCGAWLVYCRRELIFPRVLLLIPVGLLLIFGLNVVRIAALMLIGDAGFTDLAVYGFHSQAGWIAFNCAACGIAIMSRRSGWLQRSAAQGAVVRAADNPTAAYLLPFLIVLGGGMIAIAVSGPSGPWQVLPPLACAAALWRYRGGLAALDWRFSWRGVVVGIGVFALWIFAARWLRPAVGVPWIPATLAQPWSTLWVLARVLGSVLIIPIAEELAYRGYLLRRLVAPDFAAVRFEGAGWWPLLVSAAVFGAAHGGMWPPALVAGLAYGMLVTRTGRLGEAVCGHATTNGLIAAAVLLGDRRELWQ